MKTPKRKHNDTFLSWGDEYYNKLSQQSMENLPVFMHTIPYSESKPKSVAELQNETWYYIKAKHTCNGMFLVDGCGGPYIELNNYRVRNCVYTPQAIKEQHRINPPATIDLTFTLDDRSGENRAMLIEALATHKTAENGQQTELPPAGGQQDCIAQSSENATQGNLLCADAAQLTARKEKQCQNG